MQTLGTAQGTQAYVFTISPGFLGDLVQDYGKVKAYTNGILYNGKYYMAPILTLVDRADNSIAISDADGYVADVTLTGRTLYKDGKWNTICLPFNVTISGSVLNGAIARPLTSANISSTTLNLTFGEAVTELVAGTPYIIKWSSGDNITSPVFSGVTIDATDRSYDNREFGDERVRFIGTYKSTTFDSEDKSVLLMGSENTLYYPTADAGIGALRAYFKIGNDSPLLSRQLRTFNINFGDGKVTGILDISSKTEDNSDTWYTLSGMKLQDKPTQKGIYINNGKKIIIK